MLSNNSEIRVDKIIYSSRGGKTANDINKILGVFIEDHLNKNPDRAFVKILGYRKNMDDGTLVFTLIFEKKSVEKTENTIPSL